MNNKQFQFKLVLLGESAVGKSSLVLRFVKGQFQDFHQSTIGAAFLTQSVCVNDTTVKFEVWDTAGQENTNYRSFFLTNRKTVFFLKNAFFFIFMGLLENIHPHSIYFYTKFPFSLFVFFGFFCVFHMKLSIIREHMTLSRYHSLAPMYYRGAQAAIVVFDITVPESFSRAQYWVKELQRKGSPDVVIALAGNKLDLANQRLIPTQDAMTYAEDNGCLYYETSAKTAANVNELFVAIAKRLPTKTAQQSQKHTRGGVQVRAPPQDETSCC